MSTNTTVVYPEYSPSWLVANFHSLPHIDFQGQPVSHTFNITSETNWDQPYKVVYLQSVLYLPWTIMFWCLMAMLAFFISLCCRVCSKYGCAPQFDTDKITDPKVLVKFYDTVTRLLRVFIAVVVIVIITDNCIYLGSHNLDVGYNMGQDALNFFFDMFNAMTDVGESLETEGVVIAQDVANAANGACPQAATMTSYIVDFNSDISSFVSLVSPMAGKVDDYHNFLTDFAVQAKNGVIYGYWAVVLMVVASFVMAMWFQSKCALKFNIVWVSMMLVFLWIVCVGEMTALVRVFLSRIVLIENCVTTYGGLMVCFVSILSSPLCFCCFSHFLLLHYTAL